MGELLFVGLGLGGVEDMSVRALNALKACDVIYGEFYTSKLIDSDLGQLERLHRQEDQEARPRGRGGGRGAHRGGQVEEGGVRHRRGHHGRDHPRGPEAAERWRWASRPA